MMLHSIQQLQSREQAIFWIHKDSQHFSLVSEQRDVYYVHIGEKQSLDNGVALYYIMLSASIV